MNLRKGKRMIGGSNYSDDDLEQIFDHYKSPIKYQDIIQGVDYAILGSGINIVFQVNADLINSGNKLSELPKNDKEKTDLKWQVKRYLKIQVI